MTADVCEELTKARAAITLGQYGLAIAAIERAEKAWQIECDLWADALLEAEKAANK